MSSDNCDFSYVWLIRINVQFLAEMTIDKVLKEKPLGVEFVLAGLAGMGTGLLTNPMDVLKTRLQLQGELAAPGSYQRVYRNTFHAAYIIARHEGVLALQSGLGPVLGLQLIINGVRLGSYHFSKRLGLTVNQQGETDVLKTALMSGFTGAAAVALGSPLYLAKVKLQAHSAHKSLIDGQPLSTWIIMKWLWNEGGFKSLYRGWNANIPRLFIGSAVQLTTFGLITDSLKSSDIFNQRPLVSTFVASAISGTVLVFSVHPFDVMATRLYNQGTNDQRKGILYNGMIDTILKVCRKEGFGGLFKGIFPHWLRIAPYVVTCQTLYEKLVSVYDDLYK